MSAGEEKIVIHLDDVAEAQTPAKTMRVLGFLLGGELYGVKISQVKEVIVPGQFTRVPNAPPFVVGVTNLRGVILSVLDLRSILSLPERERAAKAIRLIVTDTTGSVMGFIVDQVKGIFDIEEGAVQAPLTTLPNRLLDFTLGELQWGKEIFILLDLNKILQCEDIEQLRNSRVG